MHHVQAADRIQLVILLEVGRRVRAERGVDHRLHALPLENLGHAAVGGGLGEIDALEAHALVQAEGPAPIEPHDARRGGPSQQALDHAAPDERPKTGHCDDTRFVHGTPLGGGSDARLADPHGVRYHAPR